MRVLGQTVFLEVEVYTCIEAETTVRLTKTTPRLGCTIPVDTSIGTTSVFMHLL